MGLRWVDGPTTERLRLEIPLVLFVVLGGALLAPQLSFAAKTPGVRALGALTQLRGPNGCLVDRSKPLRGCRSVRALRGPAPFLGSNAVAISRDGRNVYVASSGSDAIAIFRRAARTGRLTQASGTPGCVAAKGAGGCAMARALNGPNSVVVSADGRTVYATSLVSDAIAIFRRNRSTGALTQARGRSGCVAARAMPGCAAGRALNGPDVVAVSPDGHNVYVGAFFGNAVAVFSRAAKTGALAQPSDTTGCIVNTPADGCTSGVALAAPEGMAISADGLNVYVAAAASNALGVFARDPSTGALTQATDGTACISNSPLAGCTTGIQLGGANAVAVSSDDDNVYVTSLLSNSLTTFDRAASTGRLVQKTGTSACAIYLFAVGCSLGRALSAPEGLAVSRDGASVYAAAFESGAIDIFNRNTDSGSLIQKLRRRGCVTTRARRDCVAGRALSEVSSVAVSHDGRHVYSAAFESNAVGVFKRVATTGSRGKD